MQQRGHMQPRVILHIDVKVCSVSRDTSSPVSGGLTLRSTTSSFNLPLVDGFNQARGRRMSLVHRVKAQAHVHAREN
jgi:hypothetical protein